MKNCVHAMRTWDGLYVIKVSKEDIGMHKRKGQNTIDHWLHGWPAVSSVKHEHEVNAWLAFSLTGSHTSYGKSTVHASQSCVLR